MALVVGDNSWASIAEADAYLENRIGADDSWFVLPASAGSGEDSRENMLVSAFFWMQGSPQLDIASDVTDDDVKNAQIEAALFLTEHYDDLNERRAAIHTGVESFAYSKRREAFNPSQLTIPDFILGMIPLYNTNNRTVLLQGEYDT
jgi:hypothetical protein